MHELIALPTLIFPTFAARIETDEHGTHIYDVIRKKYVSLSPEEWVRQNCVHWLISRNYPLGRSSVERRVDATGMRYDVLWTDEHLQPFLLVECKAPTVSISEHTLRQSAWYNLTLKSPYVLLTNGKTAYCAKVDSDCTVEFLTDIPEYK